MPKQFLTLDMAKKAAAAAHAEAHNNGWSVTITILDQSGLLAYVERMDDAPVSSMEISRQKGYAAIAFKRPTKAFEEQLVSGRIGVLRLQGCIPVEGGVPLVLADGSMVGAIGISGVTAAQDGQCAQAGANALLK
jgi:glc operon protein GlcG